MILCVPIYGFLQWQFGYIPFLNRMAITFGILIIVMAIITFLRPLKEPKVMPVKEGFDMKPTPLVLWLGMLVIALTVALYILFW